MSTAEAKSLLAQQLAPWRDRRYADLVAMIQDCEHHQVVGSSGAGIRFRFLLFGMISRRATSGLAWQYTMVASGHSFLSPMTS